MVNRVVRRAVCASVDSRWVRPSVNSPASVSPTPDQDKGDGELVGDEFEVVTDFHPVGGPPVQEVQVVDDEQANLAGQERVQGAAREIRSVTPRGAGVGEELQQ